MFLRRIRFGTKLAAGVLALVLFSASAMGVITAYHIYYRSLDIGRSLIESSAGQGVNVLKLHHDASAYKLASILNVLSKRVDPAALSPGYDKDCAITDFIGQEYDTAATIFLLTDKGFERISTNIRQDNKRILGTVIGSGPVYDALKAGKAYEGVAEIGSIQHIVEYRPIVRDDGVAGALFVGKRIFTDEFVRFLGSMQVDGKGYAFIYDERGVLLYHPNEKLLGVDVATLGPWGKDLAALSHGFLEYTFRNGPKVSAARTYAPFKWRFAFGMTKSEMLHGLDQAIVKAGLIGALLASAIAAVASLLMVRAFMRPIKTIALASERIAKGEYDVAIDYAAKDEIGATAAAVTALAQTVKDRIGFIQGVLDSVKSPNVIGDKAGTILSLNQEIVDFLEIGGSKDAWIGRPVSELVYGDSSRISVLQQVVDDAQPRIGGELTVTTRTGAQRHVRIDSVPIFDLDRRLIGASSVWTDLTGLKNQQRSISESQERVLGFADEIARFAGVVAEASDKLAARIEQASKGSDHQRDRIAETAAAMEQMTATVGEVARNSADAADSAETSRTMAAKGAAVVRESVLAIARVHHDAQDLKQSMEALEQQSSRIGSILEVISDIADQTNLLALNAAIEAARAGDAGRGFAVVADEVRKLAEKTMHATKEVGQAITVIQQSARDNARGMDATVASVQEATSLADQSGRELDGIVKLAELASDRIRSIATAAEQQSASSEQVGRTVEEINVIATETADGMRQSAEAVAGLGRQVGELTSLVGRMSGRA